MYWLNREEMASREKRVAKEIARVRQHLDTAQKLAKGSRCYDDFRGSLCPNSLDDLDWMRGLLYTYHRQYEVGMSCLLDDRMPQVKKAIQNLDKRIASLKSK